MSDVHLLHKLKQNEQGALEELIKEYNLYVSRIITYILRSSGQREDVEELVQDTFFSVWEHISDVRPGKLKSYLGTVARNKAKSWLRGHRELPMAPDFVEIPDTCCSLDDRVCQENLAQYIRKALRGMRPKDSEIFVRHYYYLQTAETIAREMGMPTNTVLSRLSRGRAILRKTLSKEDLF